MSAAGGRPGTPRTRQAPPVGRHGLELSTRLTLVVGKGGTGKTTISGALAAAAAGQGRPVLVVSTDPAHSLADSLRAPIAADPTPVAPNLWALEIDARRSIAAFLDHNRQRLHLALDRGTYFDDADIAALLDLPLPGIDEVTALIELMRLVPDPRWAHIVVDTAPTGHTERLFRLPAAFAAFGALLDRLQERHRFMVARLAGRYRSDEVDELLFELREEADDLRRRLNDRGHTSVILVANLEPVVDAETLRFLHWLRADELPVAGIILNRCEPSGKTHDAIGGARVAFDILPLAEAVHPAPLIPLPRLRRPVAGLPRLRRLGALLGTGYAVVAPSIQDQERERRDCICAANPDVSVRIPLATTAVQFFVGKGGTGKTTLASASALMLSSTQEPILLVSLDPAHSLGDVWATPIGDRPTQIGPGLWALEIDAPARWDILRGEWRRALDEAATQAPTRGLPGLADTVADLQEVLELVPPGVDEVIGLFLLADMSQSNDYRYIVVDSAPTGHLLRLLALPELALQWVRMLMRLTLKYREIVGLGTLAEGLVALARGLKSTASLLRDPSLCSFTIVALPEPMVLEETGRLAARLQQDGMHVAAIVFNKLRSPECPRCRPLALEQGREVERFRASVRCPVAGVPLQRGPLIGRDALRALAGDSGHGSGGAHVQGARARVQ